MATVSKKVFSIQETEIFYKFKTKIVSLAMEARYIRKQERRLRELFNKRRNWLLKNPKATADERALHLGSSFLARPSGSLRAHRVNEIRLETRAAILARGFWVGLNYQSLESKNSKAVDAKRVAAIVTSLSGRPTTAEEILSWIKAS